MVYSDDQIQKIQLLQKKLDIAIISNKKLENQLKKSTTVKHFVQLCKQYLTPSLFKLVKNNLLIYDENTNSKQYSKELKQFTLTIYILAPKFFNFFQKAFNLPSLKTLKKDINYDIRPGLNDFVFNFIKFKISNFNVNDLDCVLYVYKISLETHLSYNTSKDYIVGFNQSSSHKTYDKATHAIIVMIRGINYEWKQKIAYYLLSSCTLSNLISIVFSIIRRLRNIGVNILALVSDQSKELVSFSKMMNVSSNKPYFDIDGQRIVYIFNPPTLLRTTRDIFFKHSLYVNDEVVERKYLDMYYFIDISNSDLCSMVELTHKHIHPGPFDEINISLATKVFSGSVAESMSIAMNRGILPISSQPTINFINNMHKLFNIFKNPYQNIAPQKDFLFLMTELFKKMKVIDNSNKSDITYNVEFINGWLISISGLIMLWETFNPTINRDYAMCTNSLNEDFLVNWFDKLRKSNVNDLRLTSIQFVRKFNILFFKDYFQYIPGPNFNEDLGQIIRKISDQPLSNNIFNIKQHNLLKCSPIVIDTPDYRIISFPNRNSLSSISGYLMNKCLEKHSCEICISYAYCQKTIDQYFFSSFLCSPNSTYSKLSTYQEDFKDYIMKLDNIFVVSFPTISIEDNVGTQLKDCLSNVKLNHPCNDFDKTLLLNLYISIRIFCAIKFLNDFKCSENEKLANIQIMF
ncbi:Transposable element P transposase [Aphis craccivora]|uniref:Transposable element P transposase n=1 Tax=Aphis craccivora TaxID=307492 RepID=A0A6G0ZAW5_APHCR|nr:Transposable element P transposase [Aphis craccivora]